VPKRAALTEVPVSANGTTQTAPGARTSAFYRFSVHWSGAICLVRALFASALSADIAQDKWQIAPQAFDLG